MKVYSILYKTLRGFMSKFLFPTRVKRSFDRYPEGPVVLCSNHLSGTDIILLMATSERQIRFMAKKELFRIPFLHGLMKAMGAFPIDRGGRDVGALRKGRELLERGEVVGIFPQGTRCTGVSPSETTGRLHAGAVLLAEKTKAALLPASIYTKNFKIRPFKKVFLSYGEPMPYEEYAPLLESGAPGEGRAEVMRRLFARICEMNKEAQADSEKKKAPARKE